METSQAQSDEEVGFFTIVKITFLSAPRKASTAHENQRQCLKEEFLNIAYFRIAKCKKPALCVGQAFVSSCCVF
jgi:hypothetical protein